MRNVDCFSQPCSQVLSHTRRETRLSLSLSRSIGMGRREPWEHGWAFHTFDLQPLQCKNITNTITEAMVKQMLLNY